MFLGKFDGVDDDQFEMLLFRPLIDAGAMGRARRRPKHDEQLLLLLILNQLAIGQPAGQAGAVQLILAMHPRRRTGGEDKRCSEKRDSPTN